MESTNEKQAKVWHKGLISSLEPRLMYDGAAVVAAVEVVAASESESAPEASESVDTQNTPMATDQGPADEKNPTSNSTTVTTAEVVDALNFEVAQESDDGENSQLLDLTIDQNSSGEDTQAPSTAELMDALEADPDSENSANSSVTSSEESSDENNPESEVLASTDTLDETDATDDTRTEIAFIDASVKDADVLEAGIDPLVEVYYLDTNSSGLSQMADILADKQDIDAIHLFSHGSSGDITLGAEHLTSENIDSSADDLATIGQAMDENGDILLYGCNIGEDTGFIDQLAELTDADVAASDDATGSNELGGDWDLEISTGPIESGYLTVENYTNVFATTLINGLGGSAGFGENAHTRNDDVATGAIDLTSVFGASGVNFGGTYYTELYINNNGVVNFGSPTDTYTAGGLSSGVEGIPAIAVYWTDLDTSSGSVVASAGGTSQGTNLVYWDIDTVNNRVIVTWDDVGEYQHGTTAKIAAQIVLEDAGSGDMDFSIRYEYAAALDDHAVQAGWNVGVLDGTSGVDYYEIPLNGTGPSALADLDTRAGNTGVVGLWEFSLRGGGVSDAGAAEFNAINEDITTNNGQTVSAVFGDNIAVTQLDDSQGDWQYSLNSGTSWSSFSATSGSSVDISTSARLLDTTAYVRFIPNANWNGDTSLDFKVWTGAGGSNGGTINATISSEVSANSAEATLEVSSVNDAPEITNGPDTASLPETDATLTTSGSLTVTDVDTTDIVTASVYLESSSGDAGGLGNAALESMLSITPTSILDGSTTTAALTWDFDSGAETFGHLGVGETLTLLYTIKAIDNNALPLNDTETVTITVTGTNDAPVITVVDVAGDITERTTLTDNGSITFTDLDLTDLPTATEVTKTLTATLADDSTVLTLTAGQQAAIEAGFSVSAAAGNDNNGTINWEYTISEANLDFLADGETVTAVFTITADDSNGGTDTQDVTITLNGTYDAPVIAVVDVQGDITEGTTLTDSGSITFTDLDLTDRPTATEVTNTVTATLADDSTVLSLTAGQQAAIEAGFTISADAGNSNNGTINWDYTISEGDLNFLAAGETVTAVFTITVNDSEGGTDTQDVTITINGTNDAPVITVVDVVGDITEGSILNDTGSISFADLDLTDTPTATEVTKTVTATQGNGSVPLTLTSGQRTAIEAAFSISAAAGNDNNGTINWDYTIANSDLDFLADGEKVTAIFTISVNDGNGSTVAQDVTININNSNDTPVITVVDVAGDITEGSILADNGSITFTDLDLTDLPTATEVTNTVTATLADDSTTLILTTGQQADIEAAFTISADTGNNNNGTIKWDYTISEAELNFLAEGETVTAVFTITVDDSNGGTATQDVTVTINGTNDIPTIGTTVSAGFTEAVNGSNMVLNESGTVTFDDLDGTDVIDITYASNNDIAWSGGTIKGALAAQLVAGFTTTATDAEAPGTTPWTYSSTGTNLDFLAKGETLTFSYTVTATDNTGATATDTVAFTITGTNDTGVAGSLASPQSSQAFQPFQYSIPASIFSDADTNDSFTYSVTGLPQGLSFSSGNLQISGSPTEAGTFVITVIAKDQHGAATQVSFSITIDPAPVTVMPSAEPAAPNVDSISESKPADIPSIDPGPEIPLSTDNGEGRSGEGGLGDDTGNDKGNDTSFLDTILAGTETWETAVPDNGVQDTGDQNSGGEKANERETVVSREIVRVDSLGQLQFDEQSEQNSAVSLSVEFLQIDNDTGAFVLQLYTDSKSTVSNYTASMGDGSELPQWLQFDPAMGTVTGQPPAGVEKIDLTIEVINEEGKAEILHITVDFEANTDLEEIEMDVENSGKIEETTSSVIGLQPLSAQLEELGRVADNYGDELLNALA